MPLLTIDNAGSLGLITDLPFDAMPLEAWNEIDNVRCENGVINSFGSDLIIYDNGTEAPKFFFNMRSVGDPHWLVATNGKIFKINNTTHTDITNVGGDYSGVDASIWSGFDFHRHQIFNVDSGSDLPQVLLPGASNMVDLTNWPASTYCKYMNTYKNFLFAYNMTDGGTLFPSRIKWSALADTGALPTTWDETDLTELAGENDIAERGSGEIFAARTLLDMNYIYKNNSIWYLYPRNDLRVWNFKEMEENQGILGPYALTAYKKKHYLAIPGDIVENNGQRITSIIDKFNRKWLFDNIHDDYFKRVQLITNYLHKEIWICFPSKQSTGLLDVALIWNIVENTWSRRELNNFSYLANGIIDTSDISQIIDDDTGIIDLDETIIDAIEFNPSAEYLMAGDPTGTGYFQLDDNSSGILSGGCFQRHGLTITGRDRFGEWKYSSIASKQILRLYPKFGGVGSFNIYAGVAKTIKGAITWSPPEVYTIGGTPHVDFFNVTGEVMAIRIEALGNQIWTYSGIDMEINVTAENVF